VHWAHLNRIEQLVQQNIALSEKILALEQENSKRLDAIEKILSRVGPAVAFQIEFGAPVSNQKS
jgi:hypothetical protein